MSKMEPKAVHEIEGYGIVLPMVQNYYPVEEDKAGFYWGFKYASGVFEYFHHAIKKQAEVEREEFIVTLNSWHKRKQNA